MAESARSRDRNGESFAHRDATDAAGNRPMSVEEVASTYADYADWMHRMEWFDRVVTGRYRDAQFGGVGGRVLDVACGTGTNFRYLDPAADLVGIDVSPDMLEKAAETLDGLAVEGDLHRMDAADLDFADDSFETVVSALSTCTFPEPVAALREMERVCEPGGRILLLEHGLSDRAPVARFQRWRADAHYETQGCRWTQEPLELVRRAGLDVEATSTGVLGMVTTIDAAPGGVDG